MARPLNYRNSFVNHMQRKQAREPRQFGITDQQVSFTSERLDTDLEFVENTTRSSEKTGVLLGIPFNRTEPKAPPMPPQNSQPVYNNLPTPIFPHRDTPPHPTGNPFVKRNPMIPRSQSMVSVAVTKKFWGTGKHVAFNYVFTFLMSVITAISFLYTVMYRRDKLPIPNIWIVLPLMSLLGVLLMSISSTLVREECFKNFYIHLVVALLAYIFGNICGYTFVVTELLIL